MRVHRLTKSLGEYAKSRREFAIRLKVILFIDFTVFVVLLYGVIFRPDPGLPTVG
jgi:uncharacterized ion transporter superfamily protein YfcC